MSENEALKTNLEFYKNAHARLKQELRVKFASGVLAGLAASDTVLHKEAEHAAKIAVSWADALIAKLEEKSNVV